MRYGLFGQKMPDVSAYEVGEWTFAAATRRLRFLPAAHLRCDLRLIGLCFSAKNTSIQTQATIEPQLSGVGETPVFCDPNQIRSFLCDVPCCLQPAIDGGCFVMQDLCQSRYTTIGEVYQRIQVNRIVGYEVQIISRDTLTNEQPMRVGCRPD